MQATAHMFVSLRKDELEDAPLSCQADRDEERLAVPGDVRQDDDQGDEGNGAKAGHHGNLVTSWPFRGRDSEVGTLVGTG